MTSSGDNLQDSTSENGDLLRQEDAVSLVRSVINAKFKDLKKQILNTEKPINY